MRTFYLCTTCGNLVEKINDGGTTPSCCGHPMSELQSASTDGAKEAHVPVFSTEVLCGMIQKVHVTVGEKLHPSENYHFINWIIIETDRGVYRKMLSPGQIPKADFYLELDEKIENVYAYCNLHGLWQAKGR